MCLLSFRTSTLATLSLLLCGLSAGCDDDGGEPSGGGGSGGGTTTTTGDTTGGGGSGGGATTSSSTGITDVRAPDRFSILITVSGVEEVPTSASAYVITSEHGPLAVETVTFDAATNVIELQTGKQKLGVTYTLSIQAPGDLLDGLGGDFLAADTATFWAVDFATFQPYEVLAERVGVGDHVVLYLEPGLTADDIPETISEFDDHIFPIETEIFHEAPDQDGNGRILLLGLDGGPHYGGYFGPLDTLPEDFVFDTWGQHSNEMEMLYINVGELGRYWPDQIVVHEFSHLLFQAQHPVLQEETFEYHNEGLAECATHIVYGQNSIAAWYYVSDPDDVLAKGKSLVHWEAGNYIQYAQAYVFWTYIASQTGGVEGYRDLFVSHGSPASIQQLLLDKLGMTFAETQLSALAAAWIQAPTGPLGFEGLLTLPGKPKTVPPGTSWVTLAPFAAALFPQTMNGIVPSGPGQNVRFLAIDGQDQLDATAPYDAAGGVLIALNARLDWENPAAESSGTFGAAMAGAKVSPPAIAGRDRSWLHPPPAPPVAGGALEKWRKRTQGF